jgi:hypothetical protein
VRPAILIAVLAVVAIATAVALRYGAGRLDGVVASTVERYGGAVTGTDVDVGGVDLALTNGRAELVGLTVANPRGYETDYAVRISRANVELDVASLAGEVPVVEEIVLDGVAINAEQRGAATNLTDIQEHATSSPGEPTSGAEPGRIVIERFRVNDARLTLTSEYSSSAEELPLKDVLVENIGGSTGATYSEAAEAMLLPIVAAAQSAAAERLRNAAGEAVSDAAREELEEESTELQERADETRIEVSERVEELLDRE